MAFNVIDKVNSRKLLHIQNRFLILPFRKVLSSALIQPLSGYACTAWFSNISNKLRLRFQATQNKCMSFYLQLDKMSRNCGKKFLELSWRNVHDRYPQFNVSDISKFYNKHCPDCFNEDFCTVGDNGLAMHFCNKQLKLPFRNSKLGMQSLSFVEPSTSKNISSNLKTVTNINCFKHAIQKYFLKILTETEADIL